MPHCSQCRYSFLSAIKLEGNPSLICFKSRASANYELWIIISCEHEFQMTTILNLDQTKHVSKHRSLLYCKYISFTTALLIKKKLLDTLSLLDSKNGLFEVIVKCVECDKKIHFYKLNSKKKMFKHGCSFFFT